MPKPLASTSSHNYTLLTMEEKISVITVYDHTKSKAFPWRLKWRGRVYQISKIGYHHTRESGRTLYHIFSVSAGNLYFRLSLNTATLFWILEETYDDSSSS